MNASTGFAVAILLVAHQDALASQPTDNNSMCVSNRGHPYGEKDCKKFGLATGCSWNNGTCSCMDGQSYSRRERCCKRHDHKEISASQESHMFVPEDSIESDICLSNRGQPYDEKQCNGLGLAKGCSWKNGTCSCLVGQTYSRRERHCKGLGHNNINSASSYLSFEMTTSDRIADDSICVSNRNKPYTQKQCSDLGLAKGCSWKNGSCSCADGHLYSRRQRRCTAPGHGEVVASRMLVLCVSRDGYMHDQAACTRFEVETGCAWMNGTCACVGSGVFITREQRCSGILV